MGAHHGTALREALRRDVVPFIGVYDVLSASVAARHFDGIFISGYSFAASFYGLPDVGFISWSDVHAFVQRIRAILPRHHVLVDVDDGYCDVEVARHVVALLEAAGASGVLIEDQRRPRRCGHLAGKEVLPLDEFLPKLRGVLDARRDMFVVARTDATDRDDVVERAVAFAEAGADAVLLDGTGDLDLIKEMASRVRAPLAFNQIAGGKSHPRGLEELRAAGVSLPIYSTPCLFAAQAAVDETLRELRASGGLLAPDGAVDLRTSNEFLNENLRRRHTQGEVVD